MLDPIDGTKSFMSGMPAWGTLIALTRFGEPVFGMMNQPFIGERFTGDGGAAHYRGPAGDRDLRVRACAALAEAVMFTTSPLLMNKADRKAFGKVEAAVRLSRYGGDCYAYCMLAAGHVDLVIETELKPYDIVAMVPIITGAGGIVTTWENGPPLSRRAHRRCRRQARARGGVGSCCKRRGLTIRIAKRSDLHAKSRRARHEGVERRQHLAAETILLHQEFVARARHDQVRAGAQPRREFVDRPRRNDLIVAGGDHQHRLADLGG